MFSFGANILSVCTPRVLAFLYLTETVYSLDITSFSRNISMSLVKLQVFASHPAVEEKLAHKKNIVAPEVLFIFLNLFANITKGHSGEWPFESALCSIGGSKHDK